MIDSAAQFTVETYNTLINNHHNLFGGENAIYSDKDGALRPAREYARGLCDFPYKEAKYEVSGSYSSLCVRLYGLNPPIDAGDWNREIMKVLKEWYKCEDSFKKLVSS